MSLSKILYSLLSTGQICIKKRENRPRMTKNVNWTLKRINTRCIS